MKKFWIYIKDNKLYKQFAIGLIAAVGVTAIFGLYEIMQFALAAGGLFILYLIVSYSMFGRE